jgi:hypothetical protein
VKLKGSIFLLLSGNCLTSSHLIANRSFSVGYVSAQKHATYEVKEGVAVIKIDSPGSKVSPG